MLEPGKAEAISVNMKYFSPKVDTFALCHFEGTSFPPGYLTRNLLMRL